MLNADKRCSQQMQNEIKTDEGCRLVAYLCPAGVWTVGYGHTQGVHPGMTMTVAQALTFFQEDLQIVERVIQTLVSVPLTQGQFDALCSFVFNVGSEHFKDSTLLRLLNQKKYVSIPAQLKRWVFGEHGEKLPGLVNRRDLEIEYWNQAK